MPSRVKATHNYFSWVIHRHSLNCSDCSLYTVELDDRIMTIIVTGNDLDGTCAAYFKMVPQNLPGETA
jgi:uncharacterized protein with PIN domain